MVLKNKGAIAMLIAIANSSNSEFGPDAAPLASTNPHAASPQKINAAAAAAR